METDETTVENLENLTTEELEQKAEEQEAEGTHNIDWEAKAKEAERKANALQRILNKKKPITNNQTNHATDVTKDIAEIKFIHKVSSFAEENNISRVQAERVLKLYPDATSETLKDPFVSEGIKALGRKERVDDATPGAGKTVTVNGKSFSEMDYDERVKNFEQFTK